MLFPPLVTGTVILSIGLSLFPVAIKYMAGGAGSADFGSARNWLVALLTFAIVFLLQLFCKRIFEVIRNFKRNGYWLFDFFSFRDG